MYSLTLTWMIGPTMNLISKTHYLCDGTHHLCENGTTYLFVIMNYLIITSYNKSKLQYSESTRSYENGRYLSMW